MHFILFVASPSRYRTVCSETSPDPMCPRNTADQTHTPARAPWQIITPTASRELNAHVGPITTLDKGHGTPKTLLLCLSPKLCVCFAWLSELYLQIFKAFCSLCIVSMLENVINATTLKFSWNGKVARVKYVFSSGVFLCSTCTFLHCKTA